MIMNNPLCIFLTKKLKDVRRFMEGVVIMSAYPVYLKTMAGDLLQVEYTPSQGWDPIREALGSWLNAPGSLLRFHPAETPKENDLICVFVDERRLCFNRTAGEYFPFESTAEYDAKIAHLLTILTRTPLRAQDRNTSRWDPTDHILFVPSHLIAYVESNYNQICF